ncbi:MAG: adenylate/guanylate cyclase domain-containing protein, partial [Rhodospirillaceae bacterium]|nr:adenylate/guanylate cyclase domain-containing protein [Rhodospirillaceae bacterium]
IMLSGDTAAAGGKEFPLREIDRIRVVGRQEPVAIYEPLGGRDGVIFQPNIDLERYARATDDYRSGRFQAAAESFAKLAQAGDKVAASMATRAAALAADPPSGAWDGVTNLDAK